MRALVSLALLATLSAKMRKQLLNKALQHAAKVLLPKLQDAAPFRTGSYRESFKVKIQKPRGAENSAAVVTQDGRAHLLEFGHAIKNSTGSYGNVPADPHIRPTTDANADALVGEIGDYLRAHFAEALK